MPRAPLAIPFVAFVVATGCGGCGSGSSVSATKGKTAIQLLRSLKLAGLPIGAFVNYTASTDENHLLGRPGEYVHKVNFRDKRLPKSPYGLFDIDGGGSIETFASGGDAKRRYDYVHSISSSGSPIFAEYEYLVGTALLRLSHKLTPTQAQAYQRTFKGG